MPQFIYSFVNQIHLKGNGLEIEVRYITTNSKGAEIMFLIERWSLMKFSDIASRSVCIHTRVGCVG